MNLSEDKILFNFFNSFGFPDPAAVLELLPNPDKLATYVSDIQRQTVSLLESYIQLRNWVNQSLGFYASDFITLLFPIFVHTFFDLISKDDLQEAQELMSYGKKDFEQYFPSDVRLLDLIRTKEMFIKEKSKPYSVVDKYSHLMSLRVNKSTSMLFTDFLKRNHFTSLLNHFYKYVKLSNRHVPISNTPFEYYQAIIYKNENEPFDFFDSQEFILKNSLTLSLNPELIPRAIKERIAEFREISVANQTKKVKVEPKRKNLATILASKTDSTQNPHVVPVPPYPEFLQSLASEDVARRATLSSKEFPCVCCFTVFNGRNTVNCLDFDRSGAMVACGCANSAVRVWDVGFRDREGISEQNSYSSFSQQVPVFSTFSSITPDVTILGHSESVYGVNFSLDSLWILSGSHDGTIRLSNTETETNNVCYKQQSCPIWDVQFSNVGYYFVASLQNKTAKVFTTNCISPVRVLQGHLSDVTCSIFHPNLCYVATGSEDCTARLWALSTGKCVRVFAEHRCAITAIAISPSGKIIATGTKDGTVSLFEIEGGTKIFSQQSHSRKAVNSLSFGIQNHKAEEKLIENESSILASGGSDGSVCIWDIEAAFKYRNTNVHFAQGALDILDVSSELGLSTQRMEELRENVLIQTYMTRQTPVMKLSFTQRNLLLAGGVFQGNKQTF